MNRPANEKGRWTVVMIVPLAIGLILGGLVICWLRDKPGNALLALVLWWVGIIMVVIGLVLLLAPVFVWLDHQLVSMFGLG